MTTMSTVAKVSTSGGDPSNPTFFDIVSLNLVAHYVTGGYTAIAAQLKAVLGKGKTIVDVACLDGKGYVIHYDLTNDKLICYYAAYKTGAAADGPLIEVVNDADLNAVHCVRLLVISQ